MTVLDAVCSDLRARGYTIDRSDDRGSPPAIGTGGDAPLAFADGPLAVEPVDGDPTTLVERAAGAAGSRNRGGGAATRAAHAARHDRAVLYVVAPDRADAVHEVLDAPRFVESDADGRRTFYHVPDRIQLGDGLACVRADGPLTWREETPGALGDGDALPLVLEADGEVQAALDTADALTCPSPSAFPYRYRREGGTFRVERRDGHEVGRYRTVREMTANAYRPVPLPLVPDHHLRWGTPAMALAVVDGETVAYERV